MKNTIYFDAEFAPLLLVNEEQVGSNSIVINIEADSTVGQSLLVTMDSGTTTSLTVTPGQENSLAIDEAYWSLGGSTFVSLVKGGLTSNSITLIFPETINTDASLEETSNLTYTMTGSNTVTEQIDNLDDRVAALEQGGGGNKVYTSVANPNSALGNEGDLWVRYHNEYDDKFINSDNEEISVNIPRYESDTDAYNYVDTTIRPILRTIKDTSANKLGNIVKQFEKECTVVLYQIYFSSSAPGGAITTSQFPQLVIDTYTVNNQSVSVIQGDTILSSGGTTVTSRAIGSNKSAIVNVDDFDGALAEDGGNWHVIYDYLYYNTTTKYLNAIRGYLDINWYFHTLPHDTLNTIVTNYSIDLIDTSFAVIDEVYCKINGKWILYEGSGEGGTNVEITQILTSGTEIAQIDLNGDVVSIYAPTPQTISYVQTLASGTNIGTITINGTPTPIYAPPSGSTVTVTPKTSTGTNIADIEVDGTIYQLFAPSGGGGGGSGSGYTEMSLWSGYKSDTGTISLNDSAENYDVVLIRMTSHPEQPSNSYYESYFTILTKDIIYNQHWQYSILVVRGAVDYGNGSMDCYFADSTSFVIEAINIASNARNVKPAVLEVIGLKFGGGSGHNYSTTEQVVGTWIDGSTLYEKTQYGGITFSSQGTWYNTDITNIDKVVSVQGSINRDGEPINLGYWNSSIISSWILRDNTLKMAMQAKPSGETFTLNSITVRYTKTS